MAQSVPPNNQVQIHYFRQQRPDCRHCGEPRITDPDIKATLAATPVQVPVRGTHWVTALALRSSEDPPSKKAGRETATGRLFSFLNRMERSFDDALEMMLFANEFLLSGPDGDTSLSALTAANAAETLVRRRRYRGVAVLTEDEYAGLVKDLRRAEGIGHAAAGRAFERAFRGDLNIFGGKAR